MGHIAEISILQVLILLVVVIIVIGPAIHILLSKRSHGGAKFGWFLAAIIAPVIAYITFLVITKPTDEQSITDNG